MDHLLFRRKTREHNPFLLELRSVERELIIGSFLSLYRVAHWSKDGALLGERPRPVVSPTVRDAASNLAAAFRSNFEQSPFHVEGSTQLLPTVCTLLKAFDNDDPPPQHQKAVTPKLLQKFYQLLASGPQNRRVSAYAHIANLVLGAFFFAMHSCKYTKTAWRGRTKGIRMGGIIFRTWSRRVLLLTDPDLLKLAEYITIIFEDQRMERKRTPDPNADPAMPTCAPSFAGDQPSSASLQLSLTGLTRPPCARSRLTTKLWKSATSSSGDCFGTPAFNLGDLPRPDSTLTRLVTGPFAQEPQCPFSSWTTRQQKS
jgi:hypothetical protein